MGLMFHRRGLRELPCPLVSCEVTGKSQPSYVLGRTGELTRPLVVTLSDTHCMILTSNLLAP